MFFIEPLTECFFVEPKWFFYGLSAFIFKSVQSVYCQNVFQYVTQFFFFINGKIY